MSPLATAACVVLGGAVVLICELLEAALGGVSGARVAQMAHEERPGAKRLSALLERRAEHLSALVLARWLGLAVAAGGAAAGAAALNAWAIAAAIAAVAVVLYALGAVACRTVGRRFAYPVALRAAFFGRPFFALTVPVARALVAAGNAATLGRGFKSGPFAGDVELREMVDLATNRGAVENDERRMLLNVVDLGETVARAAMVPRPEVVWIEAEKDVRRALSLCIRSGFSRLPVVGDGLDDVVGIVHLKELVGAVVERPGRAARDAAALPVTEVMAEPVFVPDSKPLDELLHEMQAGHNHMVVVIDEYGGVAGVLTLEDILEDIVGEIADEHDAGEEAPVEQVGPRRFRVVARLVLEDLIDEVEDAIGYRIELPAEVEEQVDTVAGLMGYGLGKVPLPGTAVDIAGLKLRAEGGTDRRGQVRTRHVVVDVPAEPGEGSET